MSCEVCSRWPEALVAIDTWWDPEQGQLRVSREDVCTARELAIWAVNPVDHAVSNYVHCQQQNYIICCYPRTQAMDFQNNNYIIKLSPSDHKDSSFGLSFPPPPKWIQNSNGYKQTYVCCIGKMSNSSVLCVSLELVMCGGVCHEALLSIPIGSSIPFHINTPNWGYRWQHCVQLMVGLNCDTRWSLEQWHQVITWMNSDTRQTHLHTLPMQHRVESSTSSPESTLHCPVSYFLSS